MPKSNDYRKVARAHGAAQQRRAAQREIDAAADAYYAASGDTERREAADRLYELDPKHPIFTD